MESLLNISIENSDWCIDINLFRNSRNSSLWFGLVSEVLLNESLSDIFVLLNFLPDNLLFQPGLVKRKQIVLDDLVVLFFIQNYSLPYKGLHFSL